MESGILVVALTAPQSARTKVSFVGEDNWMVGRTAASDSKMAELAGEK